MRPLAVAARTVAAAALALAALVIVLVLAPDLVPALAPAPAHAGNKPPSVALDPDTIRPDVLKPAITASVAVGPNGELAVASCLGKDDEKRSILAFPDPRTPGAWMGETVLAEGTFAPGEERPTAVADLKEGFLAAAVAKAGAKGEGCEIRVARKLGHRAWDDRAAGGDGKMRVFHALVLWNGQPAVVWQDNKNHAGDPEAMDLYVARRPQWKPYLVDERTCPCCRPAIGLAIGGDLAFGAYREELPDGTRDIYVRAIRFEGNQLKVGDSLCVSRDGFRSEGCPGSGPSVACWGGGVVAVAYAVPSGAKAQSGAELEAGVYVARSANSAKSFPLKARLGGDGANHPVLAGQPGKDAFFAAWEDGKGGIAVAASLDGGATFGEPAAVTPPSERHAKMPSIALAPDGRSAWVSWIDHHGAALRRISASEGR